MKALPLILYVLAIIILSGAWALVIHYGDKPRKEPNDRPRDS